MFIELLTHAVAALGAVGGAVGAKPALAWYRARVDARVAASVTEGEKHKADAARASADGAAAQEVTQRHIALTASVEVSAEAARTWLKRLAEVEQRLDDALEMSKRFEALATASERRAAAAEAREAKAVRRADEADRRCRAVIEEFEEYKRADRAKAASLVPLERARDVIEDTTK